MNAVIRMIAAACLLAGAASAAPGAPQARLTLLTDNHSSLDGIYGVIAAAEKRIGVTVTVDLRPGGSEGDNIVKARLATGDMDDLCLYNSGSLFQVLNPPRNFVDLTDEPYMPRILDSFKSTVSVKGRVYGIPASTANGGGWLYNKKVYARLGLRVPTTWAALLSNCDTIKAAGTIAVLGAYKDDWTSQLIVLSDYFNVHAAHPGFAEEYTAHKATFTATPAALRGFEKLREVSARGYMNKDMLSTTFDQALMMLATGEGAHFPMLTFALPAIKALAGDAVNDIGFFAQPGDSAAGNGLTVWMPSGIYVYKNGNNVEAARKWAAFFMSAEGLNSFIEKQKPEGPFVIKGISLPDGVFTAVRDMMPYFNSGRVVAALEFLSPVKGPDLPRICVEVGCGITTPREGAKKYDTDVEKQAKQLGLPGW